MAATNATVTAERPLVVDIHFCMDGVQSLRNFRETHQHLSRFKYTVDPEVFSFTGYNQVKTVYKDEVFLNILVSTCPNLSHTILIWEDWIS